MSGAARKIPAKADAPPLVRLQLAETISAVASASDFLAGARSLLSQLSRVVDVHHACAFMLNSSGRTLDLIATVGLELEPGALSLSVTNKSDPIVAAAMTFVPISASAGPAWRKSSSVWQQLAWPHFVAVPFPRPQSNQAPSFAPLSELNRFVGKPCQAHHDTNDGLAPRTGFSPCGVMLFEMTCDTDTVTALFDAARLAGPVLWLTSSAENYQRSTQELDQQSALLTAMVNSLPDPIVIVNVHHDIIVQNRRAEHLLCVDDKASEQRRNAVETNNRLFTAHLSAISRKHHPPDGARELILMDPESDDHVIFEVFTRPLTEAGKGVVVAVLRDVTALRHAANELERQVQRVRLAEVEASQERDRLNLILTTVADPILVTDDHAKIILMNRRAKQLFADGTAPLTGNGVFEDAVRSNELKFTAFVTEFLRSNDPVRRDQMLLSFTDGSAQKFPVEVVAGKILDRHDHPIAIVSVLHDLTEQVENERLYHELKQFSGDLEARVRAATADLADQNIRLQWQSRELEKANRLKSEFLASMSHELRTPINALIGYTALMLDRIYGDLTSRQEEGLMRIQGAAQHLLALINDILDLAKIEAGQMPLHLDSVPLQEILHEINLQIDPLVSRKGLAYNFQMPPARLMMFTDRTKVKQVLLNLLFNAIKFTHAGGVTLTATQEGEAVRIDISDTGIGIRSEDIEGIWEDFRQVDQSRTREFGGTGLGLSITRKLVGALGGHVSVRSEYGAGSTFTVVLPIRTAPMLQ